MHLHVQFDWKAVAGITGSVVGVILQYGPALATSSVLSPHTQHVIGIAVNVASAVALLLSEFGVQVTKPKAP
ncbi:MAG: hypothetical protein ACYC8W_10870 [Candidatus Tyrphobacter sp.]